MWGPSLVSGIATKGEYLHRALLLGRVHPGRPVFYPLKRANTLATKTGQTPLLPTNMPRSRAQHTWHPLHYLIFEMALAVCPQSLHPQRHPATTQCLSHTMPLNTSAACAPPCQVLPHSPPQWSGHEMKATPASAGREGRCAAGEALYSPTNPTTSCTPCPWRGTHAPLESRALTSEQCREQAVSGSTRYDLRSTQSGPQPDAPYNYGVLHDVPRGDDHIAGGYG
jgi:hypothetical protein